MAHASLNHVLHLLRRMAKTPEPASATDAHLLGRFTTHREEDAFAALVRRHGPMVLGVCRRVLQDEHLSEDAFQATFLVLARKAGSISKPAVLGGWLYRVAYHIALRARRQVDRRRALERSGGDLLPEQPTLEPFQPDWRRLLADEVSRLPEKYRTPLVLCYWEGKTYEEAAAQLGCPGGTVSGRLARARQLLRSRLVRRGLALSTGALATELSADATFAALSASQANTMGN